MRFSLLGLLVLGCGDGSSGGVDGGVTGDRTAFEGIYRVETWTRNQMACDVDGPSIATMREPLFYVKNEMNALLTTPRFVNVNSCPDIATCSSEANDTTMVYSSFAFEQGSDALGWSTRSVFVFDMQGQCEGGVTETKLMLGQTSARIEQKHATAVAFPAVAGNDPCPDAKIEEALAGQPCDELEVVTATFLQDY